MIVLSDSLALGNADEITRTTSCRYEWRAEWDSTRVEDGIDAFVFRDGLIRVQTVRYRLIEQS